MKPRFSRFLNTRDNVLGCFTELGGGAVDAVIVDKPVATSYVQQNAGFIMGDADVRAEEQRACAIKLRRQM